MAQNHLPARPDLKMIQLKSKRELETMARGGKILAATIAMLERETKPGMTTHDLDKLANEFIRSHKGAVPSFKGLYGFPGNICASINQEVVHGIPSKKRTLKDGDIVSIDIGIKLDGFHTDSATTVAVGNISPESQRLLSVTRQALVAGIEAARPGNHVGDIGHAVEQVVTQAGYTVVRDMVGHGIGQSFHEDPQVPNYGKPKRGPKLQPGLTIAIEPMVNIGGAAIKTLADKWTVVTTDGSRSAHFEHTVAITAGAPLVLTL